MTNIYVYTHVYLVEVSLNKPRNDMYTWVFSVVGWICKYIIYVLYVRACVAPFSTVSCERFPLFLRLFRLYGGPIPL